MSKAGYGVKTGEELTGIFAHRVEKRSNKSRRSGQSRRILLRSLGMTRDLCIIKMAMRYIEFIFDGCGVLSLLPDTMR